MTYRPSVSEYKPERITIPEIRGNGMGGVRDVLPAAAACVANQAYYLPFTVLNNCRLLTVQFYTGAGTNNYDICLLGEDRVVLASKGAAAASVGLNTWTLTNPWFLQAHLEYWIGWYGTNTAITIGSLPSSALHPPNQGMAIRSSATFTVGNTETFAVAGTQITPLFAVTLGY